MKEVGKVFEEFVEVIAKLRHPEDGCPWDLEQTHETLAQYLIEECYEAVEAIESEPAELPNELGDVLLQVVLHSQIASETGSFDIQRVIEAIKEKMIRRHPHVFGDVEVDGSKQVLQNWEEIKLQEKGEKKSTLDGIPRHLPALQRAQRMIDKLSRSDELLSLTKDGEDFESRATRQVLELAKEAAAQGKDLEGILRQSLREIGESIS